MKIRTCGWIALAFTFTCMSPVSASASEALDQCSQAAAHKPGLLAQAWKDFRKALNSAPPNQAQRLVELRLSLIELTARKKALVTTIDQVVKNGSVPGWLAARVRQIPDIQRDVEQIMDQIREEARIGKLLGESDSLGPLMDVLARKRQITLCELAAVPLPLPEAELGKVAVLLKDLQVEIAELDTLDKSLAKLIETASRPR